MSYASRNLFQLFVILFFRFSFFWFLLSPQFLWKHKFKKWRNSESKRDSEGLGIYIIFNFWLFIFLHMTFPGKNKSFTFSIRRIPKSYCLGMDLHISLGIKSKQLPHFVYLNLGNKNIEILRVFKIQNIPFEFPKLKRED